MSDGFGVSGGLRKINNAEAGTVWSNGGYMDRHLLFPAWRAGFILRQPGTAEVNEYP